MLDPFFAEPQPEAALRGHNWQVHVVGLRTGVDVDAWQPLTRDAAVARLATATPLRC